jgi:DNA replication and repair protein RecF
MWVETLALEDVRNIRTLEIQLSPGINVFFGENAQGKTSLLEAVGLIARGRSFRSDDSRSMIRRGAKGLSAAATARASEHATRLSVELTDSERRFRLNGKPVAPGEYRGRLEVAVYSGERLRVVQGSMRERRAYLDRGAAALWPSYHQAQRGFERVLEQRNAALVARSRDLESWDERFSALGGDLRVRRAEYARRLTAAMRDGFRPAGELYEVLVEPLAGAREAEAERLRGELRQHKQKELLAGRSLVGPHRDGVRLMLDGQPAADASSGQARSLLLALTLASLDVYRVERGAPPVALLDDLDSELDDVRGPAVCARFGERGQALVTTAHGGWATALDNARVFAVAQGQVRPAS